MAIPKKAGGKKGFVLDMHVHVAGIGVGSDCAISKSLLDNWRYDLYLKAFNTSKQELKERGDSVVIDRIAESLARSQHVDGALLLALDKVYDKVTGKPDESLTEVYIPNDFVKKGCSHHPSLFYGASVNPYRPDWQEELRQAAADKAVLIKWLPAIQHIDPSDQGIIPFYRMLAELNLPLLVHTGAERSFSSSHDGLGDPCLLRLALEQGVTVIAAHVATTGKKDGEEYIDRLLPMLTKYDNLYTDISSLTQLNKVHYVSKVLQHKNLFNKFLFGSDFPLTNSGLGPFKLVSPWYFLPRLSMKKAYALSRVENVWDRDLLLKEALGFPAHCFMRPAELLLDKADFFQESNEVSS